MRYHTSKLCITEAALLALLYYSTFDPARFPTLNLDPVKPMETLRTLIYQTFPVLMMLGMCCAVVASLLWYSRSRESLTVSSDGIEYQAFRRSSKLGWSEARFCRDKRGLLEVVPLQTREVSTSPQCPIPLDGRWMHYGTLLDEIMLHAPQLRQCLVVDADSNANAV